MFSWYHWLIVVVPVLAVCIAAVRCRKYVRSVTDFLVAGRCAGRYVLLSGGMMGGLSVVTFVGNAEVHYHTGYAMNYWNNILLPMTILMGLFGAKSNNADLDGCFVYWYDANPGKRHTVMRSEGEFKALVDDLWASFRSNKSTNAVLIVGEPGGHGVIRDIRVRDELLNASDDAFRDHFTGTCHR